MPFQLPGCLAFEVTLRPSPAVFCNDLFSPASDSRLWLALLAAPSCCNIHAGLSYTESQDLQQDGIWTYMAGGVPGEVFKG